MADPKYAGLPGIAYDQPDLYETDDLPEAEQYQHYSDEESDAIENVQIDANQAFNKFKGKYVSSKGVDFSDRISRKPRIGYNVLYGEWELPEQGEKETPIQKFRRLQCEVKELYDELSEVKGKASDPEETKTAADLLPEIESMGKMINDLKTTEFGPDLMAALSDPRGNNLKNLLSQIETFKQTGESKKPQSKSAGDKKATSGEEANFMKYEMMYLPEKSRMVESKCIANLEQRLGQLEKIVGSHNGEKLSKFSQTLQANGLVDAAQQLGAKAALLDSNQLDLVDNKASSVLHKMDNIAQKKSAFSQDSELEKKISETYNMVKNTEWMSHILPETIDRMSTLHTIHEQAVTFHRSLSQLEDLQNQIVHGIEGNKASMQNIHESLKHNMDIITNNVTSLEKRISVLKK